MKRENNHGRWVVAFVLMLTCAATGSAFADTWDPFQAGDAEFSGRNVNVVLVEQSTLGGSGKMVFSSFPEGVVCVSTPNSAWISANSTVEENRLIAMALMARAMSHPVNVGVRIVDGNVCELATLQF